MSEDVFRKRPRPAAIVRTTSRRDMSCDVTNEIIHGNSRLKAAEGASKAGKNVSLEEINTSLKEEEITKPLDFLHYCGVCRRLLGSECDIFIYRGESAFCSNECRDKHIRFDTTKRNSSRRQ